MDNETNAEFVPPINEWLKGMRKFKVGCISVLVVFIITYSLFLFAPVEWYYYLLSNIGERPRWVSERFAYALSLHHDYALKNVSAESLHPRIHNWLSENEKFECEDTSSESRVLEIEQSEFEIVQTIRLTKNCEGFKDAYFLRITDLKIQLLNEQWTVIDWGEIEETIPLE